jgi:hypothetical protein
MALVGSNPTAVPGEREPLLVVRSDHVIQLFPGDRPAVLAQAASSFSTDTQPSASNSMLMISGRTEAKDRAQELAGGNQSIFPNSAVPFLLPIFLCCGRVYNVGVLLEMQNAKPWLRERCSN